MIRLLIALLIVALLLNTLSKMLPDEEANTAPEDTIVGAAYEPYERAQKFSEEDYIEALDKKREDLDKQIDGG